MKLIQSLIASGLLLMLVSCGASSKKEAVSQKDTAVTSVGEPTMPPEVVQYAGNISNEQTENLVRLTLRDLYKDDLSKNLISEESRKFIFFQYDLNGDSKNEIFVGLTGPYFCGSGGCTILLLDDQGNPITTFTVSDSPVVIDTDKKSQGWYDLFILSGGEYHIMKFNGKSYPSNPSVQPVLELLPGDGLPRALNYLNEPYPWFNF
ncbi:MAG: hypothetical protein RR202_01705 [Bacteroidales bacterium]